MGDFAIVNYIVQTIFQAFNILAEEHLTPLNNYISKHCNNFLTQKDVYRKQKSWPPLF